MTQKDISALKAESASLFPDNTNQEITPARKRSYDIDVADSCLNVAETSDQEVQSNVNFIGGIKSDGVPVTSPENVTVVNELSDFPAPVGGVIELSGGQARAYEISSKQIDLEGNVFSVTGAAVTVKGLHRVASQLLTTSSSPMFSMTAGGSLYIESCGLSSSNGNLLDITGGDVFVLDLCTIYNCISIGTIANVFIVSFRTATVISTQSGGLTFSGSLNQLNMTNCLAGDFVSGAGFGWNGTLINLGVATVQNINIQGGNRFFTTLGNIAISGLANDGNITSDGRGVVSNNSFFGEGTYLSGIDSQDLMWEFVSNFNLEDSRFSVVSYITAPEITTVSSANTYYPVEGNFTQEPQTSRFNVYSDGVIEFLSDDVIQAKFDTDIFCRRNAGGQPRLCNFRWTKSVDGGTIYNPVNALSNGVLDADNRAKGASFFTADNPSKGDKYRLELSNTEGTEDIEVLSVQMSVSIL